MQIIRFAIAFALSACSSTTSNSPVELTDQPDAATGAQCTGAVYDPCTTADQCGSMNCHLYNGVMLHVCTQSCDATTPCPDDAAGLPVACNQMGNCRPSLANDCVR